MLEKIYQYSRRLISHKKTMWAGVVVLAILITIVTYSKPKVNVDNSFEDFIIVPGDTLQNHDFERLKIVDQTQLENNLLLEIESDFSSKQNEIILDSSNKVLFIKEHVVYDPLNTIETFKTEIGNPTLILEAPNISSAVNAFVFLNEGLVIIAHKNDGVVEQKWLFEPTDEQSFMQSWGKDMELEGTLPLPDPINL